MNSLAAALDDALAEQDYRLVLDIVDGSSLSSDNRPFLEALGREEADAVLLRKREAELILGYRSDGEPFSTSYLTAFPAESRARLERLFSQLIEGNHAEIIADYEVRGPIARADALHRSVSQTCGWLLDVATPVPSPLPLPLEGEGQQVDTSPLAGQILAYLRLAAVRALREKGFTEASRIELLRLVETFGPPASWEFIWGEVEQVAAELGLPIQAPAPPHTGTSYLRATRQARSALSHLASGDLSLASAITVSLMPASMWQKPLAVRLSQIELGLALAADDADDASSYWARLQEQLDSHHASRFCASAAGLAGVRAGLGRADVRQRLPLYHSLLLEALGHPAHVTLECITTALEALECFIDHAMLNEAAGLVTALSLHPELLRSLCKADQSRLLSLVEVWALQTGRRPPKAIRTLQAYALPSSDVKLLNDAHAHYVNGMIEQSRMALGRVSRQSIEDSPLNFRRYLLLSYLTDLVAGRRAPAGPDIVSLLVPPYVEPLLDLARDLAKRLAKLPGAKQEAVAILDHLAAALPEGSPKRISCFLELAELCQLTGQHWRAAKLFRELREAGYPLLGEAESIHSLALFREAENLFLNFNHAPAVQRVRELLDSNTFNTPSAKAEKAALLKMAGISYEELKQFTEAGKAWEQLVNLELEPGNREIVAYAAHRAGLLRQKAGEFEEADAYFSASYEIYNEIYGPSNEHTKRLMVLLGIVGLSLSANSTAPTYRYTAPTSDVVRLGVDG